MDELQVQRACGNCPLALLYCFSCLRSNDTLAQLRHCATKYSWCKILTCRVCSKNWFICTECMDQRAHMKTLAMVHHHHKNKHECTDPELDNEDRQDHNDDSLQEQSTVSQFDGYFTNEMSQKFFEHDLQGHGMNYLVAMSAFHQSNVSINEKDTKMLMTLSHFVATYRGDRSLLGDVLNLTMETAI